MDKARRLLQSPSTTMADAGPWKCYWCEVNADRAAPQSTVLAGAIVGKLHLGFSACAGEGRRRPRASHDTAQGARAAGAREGQSRPEGHAA